MAIYKSLKNSYFFSAFFWSTLSKVLNAVFGFISVPLLLGFYGKAEYGLLSIATACNGYMHLMDLGMNTGAVKFFAQWEAEGKRGLIYRVARTNITFYFIISLINILGLLALAFWGESFFSVTHDQFSQLRYCFYILALFSIVSWITTAYTQLLTAFKNVTYIMQIQCVQVLFKVALIAFVFLFNLSLIQYFFYLTFIVAIVIVPYMIKSKKEGYIDSHKPTTYWRDFKIVLTFSLALFALSIFQVTATQARPIVLSIFAENGAETVADYRIVEVIPQFIITVCGTFVSIFLPKSSEMMIKDNKEEIQEYVNGWTVKTTILVCVLCFPFIVGGFQIIGAYVGVEYGNLTIWLQLWCVFLIVQMHSTPAFSFVLAKGKTKVLVIGTAIACVISILINIVLCKTMQVGSAIVGYIVYMLCLIGVYYMFLYKRYLGLKSWPIFVSFLKPLLLGGVCCVVPYIINVDGLFSGFVSNTRIEYLLEFSVLSLSWLIPYGIVLLFTNTIRLSEIKNKRDVK